MANDKTEREVRLADLESALAPFSPEGNIPKELVEALDRTLVDPDSSPLTHETDLTQFSDADLAQRDHVAQARVAYLVSYLRVAAYLKAPADSLESANAQARVAMQFIKHVETTGLKTLMEKRTAGETEMLRRRDELTLEMMQLARDMAEASRRREEREESGKTGVIDAEILEDQEA